MKNEKLDYYQKLPKTSPLYNPYPFGSDKARHYDAIKTTNMILNNSVDAPKSVKVVLLKSGEANSNYNKKTNTLYVNKHETSFYSLLKRLLLGKG